MLRIDHQRARSREAEPGADRGFSKSQRRHPVRRRKSPAGLRLGGAGSAPAAVPKTRPPGARLVAALPGKITGRSRAQVTRLIARYRAHGELQPVRYRRHRFPQRYTRADVELLATVDEAHETLSGPATRRILERAYQQYGQAEYQRLATISVAHLYNL